MEIMHRIAFNPKGHQAFLDALDKLGFVEEQNLDPNTDGLIVVWVDEADPRWETVAELTEEYRAVHQVQTYFTEDEILVSDLVRLSVTYELGYPQPEKTWVSTKPNYEQVCRSCGTFQQRDPFRIKSEPNLRGNDFMTLIWGRPIFGTNEVIAVLEEENISGFEPWEVLIHSTGIPSQRIQQLKITDQSEPGFLDAGAVGYEDCKECGERKYFAHRQGVMRYRRDAILEGVDIFSSHEWFGAGGRSAYREVFISPRLAELIVKKGWNGVAMKAVELVG